MADAASAPTATVVQNGGEHGITIRWGTTTISGVATGLKAAPGAYANRWTLQVSGTYGGATWTFQGSNDGSTWFTLNNDAATAVPLTFSTGDKLMNVLERPRYVRVITTGGTGTALVVILHCTNS